MSEERTGSVVQDRVDKAQKLEAMGVHLYPSGFRVDMTSSEALNRFGGLDAEALEHEGSSHVMAGRIMAIRDFGKASFIHIKDGTGRIQAYIRKDKVGEEKFSVFRLMDIGEGERVMALARLAEQDDDREAAPVEAEAPGT